MEAMEILAFSISAGAVSIVLFSIEKVKKLEKRVMKLEDKLNEK